MKKKILAMMSALILTITCIAPLNVKASESSSPRWWVQFIHDDGTVHESDWVEPGHAWGYSMDESTGGTLKLITTVRLYFDIGRLEPNEKLYFEMDASFGGIKPNLLGTVHYFVANSQLQEITPNILYEQGYTSPELRHVEKFEYENNSTTSFDRFVIEFNLIETSNIKFIMTQVEANMKESFTDDYIKEDTNIKVGGILETVKSIFNGIISLPGNIAESVSGFFQNVVDSINGGNSQVESNDDLENSTNDLENKLDKYDDLESGFVEDFDNNIGAITPNNDLLTNNDFVNTSTFVATQMTRIYESNDIVRMTITFGLIIGLAFTVIGISVRR